MRFLPAFVLTLAGGAAFAQPGISSLAQPAASALQASATGGQSQTCGIPTVQSSTAGLPDAPDPSSAQQPAHELRKQPKRILGIMPNYRAVSAGTKPPPPTPKQAFKIATQNSFDYSSFVFVGLTSLLAEGDDAHPSLGKGVPGFWAYSWRGFLDKADGNYWVIFALPTVFHEDERYYSMGEGGILKRGIYASSRILITPNYRGHNTFNASEILGRGVSQAISVTYYPGQDRTFGEIAEKYGYALGRDALTNTFREFWPDIAAHLPHRHSH